MATPVQPTPEIIELLDDTPVVNSSLLRQETKLAEQQQQQLEQSARETAALRAELAASHAEVAAERKAREALSDQARIDRAAGVRQFRAIREEEERRLGADPGQHDIRAH
jgi:septal ring factor EnvC (AmiA/AmiB activator)